MGKITEINHALGYCMCDYKYSYFVHPHDASKELLAEFTYMTRLHDCRILNL